MRHSNHRNGLGGEGQEQLCRTRSTYCLRHWRGDFTHHCIADENGDGAYDDIHPAGAVTNRSLPRPSPVCTCLQHLSRGNGIGSQSPDFDFFSVGLPDFPYDDGTNAGTLAIYNGYSNQDFVPSKGLVLFQDDAVLHEVHLFDMRLYPALFAKDVQDIDTLAFRSENLDIFHEELFPIISQEICIGFTH